MNRKRIEELINALNTGQASEEEAKEVQEAISQDESLANFYRATKNIKNLVDATPKIKVSSDFATRVISASKARNSSRISQFHKKAGFRQILADFVPRTKVFGIAVLAHAILLIIAAFVVLTPAKDSSFNPNVELNTQHSQAATARISAPRTTLRLSSEGTINVAEYKLSGFLYIVVNNEDNRRMLVAFTSEQFQKQPREIRESCTPAFIRNSDLQLPPYLLEQGIGSSSHVVFLKLSDRFEIWSEKVFKAYVDDNKIRAGV